MNESIFKTYPQAAVFNKIILIEKRVQNADTFRIKEKPSSTFVSEKLKEAAQNNKSREFDFEEPAPLSRGSTK
ncbi:hypothetical protein LFL96_30880 [Paraburkholderia sp. D15]|nr:DUF1629 domain-containing protein [Paraburkholderia sp. D15]WGS52591.1 hypothetical protein LFL96_30880 [Paraburkholderia sp. D15]